MRQEWKDFTIADAGADALAQGSHIAFAPGQLDLVSMHGQALLGHELSHVVSQARGEVRGSGLLENHSLESRADREGMMAAMGQSIYPGAAATPGAAAGAAQAQAQAGTCPLWAGEPPLCDRPPSGRGRHRRGHPWRKPAARRVEGDRPV